MSDPFLERMLARSRDRKNTLGRIMTTDEKENPKISEPPLKFKETPDILLGSVLGSNQSSNIQQGSKSLLPDHMSEVPSPIKRRRFHQLSQRTAEIQQWEDDYQYHSQKEIVSPKKNNSVSTHAPAPSVKKYYFGDNLQKVVPAFNPPGSLHVNLPKKQSDLHVDRSSSPTKNLTWDSQIINSLEAQGFTPTNSKSKLVYDYKEAGTSKSPSKPCERQTQSCTQPVLTADQYISHTKQVPFLSKSVEDKPTVTNLKSQWEQHIREASPERSVWRLPSPNRQFLRQASVPSLQITGEKSPRSVVKLTKSPFKSIDTGRIVKGDVPMPDVTPLVDEKCASVKEKIAAFTTAIGLEPKQKDPAELSLKARKNIFEKVGGPAILPVAPFGQPVSTKALADNSDAKAKELISTNKSGTTAIKNRLAKFENLQDQPQINLDIQSERRKDIEMLNNRFKKPLPKFMASPKMMPDVESDTEYPESDTSVEEPVPHYEQGPPKPARTYLTQSPIEKVKIQIPTSHSPIRRFNSTAISDAASNSSASPSKPFEPRIKPGCLFPSLSDIEHSDFYESQAEDIKDSSFAESILTCVSGESLGTHIQKMAQSKQSELASILETKPETKNGNVTDSRNDELDDALEEAMIEGKLTPKRNREYDDMLNDQNYKTPKVIDNSSVRDDFDTPLTHSISMYRKQKPQDVEMTPVRQAVRQSEFFSSVRSPASPSVNVENNIKIMQEEERHQLGVISQASGAINVVHQHADQYGTPQHVEAEKLLLIASQKRLSAINEIQRLKAEGALGHPQHPDSCRGSISLSNMTLPLKEEVIKKRSSEVCHFIVLIKQKGQVIATQMQSTQTSVVNSALVFPNLIALHELTSDFNINIEVYCLKVEKTNVNLKKDHSRMKLTPLKRLQKDSKSASPVHSPSGPSSMRSSAFSMVGYTTLSMSTMARNAWALEKVPCDSVVEGHLLMRVSCTMEGGVEEKGFLTMFEDVGGFGAWNRRWCCISGPFIKYWKYPDDENRKDCLDFIDLRNCSSRKVEIVSRDICARMHTFELQLVTPVRPGDVTNLVQEVNGSMLIKRVLLSADSKGERMNWCDKLNRSLANIRAWDPDAMKPNNVSV